MQVSIPEDILFSAQTALERIEGRAAVLFGSRARDDWEENSDWDIAFIAAYETASELDESVFHDVRETGQEVNCIVVPESVLRSRACYLGSVQRAIVRDGVLVAGDYDLEALKGVPLRMDALTFMNHLVTAEKQIRSAAEAYTRVAQGDQDMVRDLSDCAEFVSASADAAERLGKAMLMRLGLDPKQTHDMNALADQALSAGYSKEAGMLRSLNGKTKNDHVAHYEVQDSLVEGCLRAGPRYAGVLALYGEMMQALPDAVTKQEIIDKEMIDKQKQRDGARSTLEFIMTSFENREKLAKEERMPEVETLLKQRHVIAQSASETLRVFKRRVLLAASPKD